MVACPEEIAYRQGWIGGEELKNTVARLGDTEYSRYLAIIGGAGFDSIQQTLFDRK